MREIEIDFKDYLKSHELIEKCNADQNRTWFQCNKSDAAILIAEMHQLCKVGLSLNLTIQRRLRSEIYYYYNYLIRVLHVFAMEQARQELGLSMQEVSTLFSHSGIDNKNR